MEVRGLDLCSDQCWYSLNLPDKGNFCLQRTFRRVEQHSNGECFRFAIQLDYDLAGAQCKRWFRGAFRCAQRRYTFESKSLARPLTLVRRKTAQAMETVLGLGELTVRYVLSGISSVDEESYQTLLYLPNESLIW